ncbi:MAG: EcoKI restriction-modification system protein HsdS [Chryseobacterium sp.]|jgi:type I restriction enzyme S subunit|nr:EcoKI restriction-modification system protein HsdS [Chryseobacterium sp.]
MKFIKLGTVCKLRNGYAFKSSAFVETGVPIIRISNINDNIVTPEKAVRIAYDKIFDNYKIAKGDILIAMSGATTGKFGIYNSDENAYQNQRVGCFQILDDDLLNQTYLLQVLKIVKPIIEKKANGGAQPNISASGIEEIIIPLPALEDQIRIAEILTRAENLVTQRKESILMCDELLKSTFLEMFGNPVRNEKRWLVKKLKDVCIKITDGTHFSPPIVDDGIPYITAKHVRENTIDFWAKPWFISEEDHKEIYKRCSPTKGDVLYIKDGATTGYAAINQYDFEFSMLSSLALLKVDYKITNAEYLCSWLNNEIVKVRILKGMAGGAIKRLTLTKINQLPINLPPIELQNHFAIILKKIEILKVEYQKSLVQLENLYGLLSQKAFKGELDVSKVDISNLRINSKKINNRFENKVNTHFFSNNDLEKHIDKILDKYKINQYFSVKSIENEFNSKKIPFNRFFIINYLKKMLDENKIKQEYNKESKQVMFMVIR